MKRLNWLKNLGLAVSVAGAATPVVLMSTSCAVTDAYIDMFDFKKVVGTDEESRDYDAATVKHYKTSFNNLLYGSMSNHKGNYILFVGSNTHSETVGFFSPNSGWRDRDQWFAADYFYQTPFFKGLVKASTDAEIVKEGIKDCGFYVYTDFFDRKFYDKKNHEIYISKDGDNVTQIVKPFEKWTAGTIAQTKIFNKNKAGYDWDETSVSASDYIRQDASAVEYRALVKRGLELYPKTDKRKDTFGIDTEDKPRMCIFKDGKLISINTMPNGDDAGITSFVKIIVDNYKVVKDEKK